MIYIRARIRRRELTGSGLARAAGFPQGHLSNFLNCRRGLSLESMDRLLDALDIDVLDLVSPEEIGRRVVFRHRDNHMERVALVSWQNATVSRITPDQVLETRGFSKSFLQRLRPERRARARRLVALYPGEARRTERARDVHRHGSERGAAH